MSPWPRSSGGELGLRDILRRIEVHIFACFLARTHLSSEALAILQRIGIKEPPVFMEVLD